MSCMFQNCSSLEELNISNFNTNNTTNMSYMFYSCKALKELDVSKFNTEKATNMNFMFGQCKSLKELDTSNFIYNNSEYSHYGMRYGCTLLNQK